MTDHGYPASARSVVCAIGAALLSGALVTACGGGMGRADDPAASGASTLSDPVASRGQELFDTRCQACHGVGGIGERPDDPMAVDEQGLPLAPALDGSMHVWHHTDDGLVATILQGSPRNPRMIAWSEAGLTEDDARAIISYLKTTWGPTQIRCQGPGHMDMACLAGSG